MSSFASAVAGFVTWKPVRLTLLALVGLVAAGAASLYGLSEWRLARTYDVPETALRLAAPASAERGDRLATVYGCKDCHKTHGQVFLDVPALGRVIAPDLARKQKAYTDAELVTLLRRGVKRDRTTALIMPADAYSSMADAEVADVIAWLRALEPDAETEAAQTRFGPLGRLLAIMDALPFSAVMAHDPTPPAERPTATRRVEGEYLVKVACNHCHRLDEPQEVKPGLTAPPVRPVVQGYSLDEFAHLMRTGKGVGGRELELMSDVARGAFSHLTDEEIAAIHAYLNAPAETVPAEPVLAR